MKNKTYTLEIFKNIGVSKGGLCLSNSYSGTHCRLRWRCKNGHEWVAVAQAAIVGRWCKKCADSEKSQKRRISLEQLQVLAKDHNGELLSKDYKRTHDKLEWRCQNSHIFYKSHHEVKIGRWCPLCLRKESPKIFNRRIKRFDTAQKWAESKGGRCLSKEYINSHTPLEWECKNGHKWHSDFEHSIHRNRWCSLCYHEEKGFPKKYTLEEAKEIAKKKEGICLSDQYKNVVSKLKWSCSEGHIWETNLSSILNGRWCPICSSGVSERVCRKYFELIFKEKFPKIRPKWLREGNSNPLELDGYCEKLHLAFEYQGKQHYEPIHHFIRSITFKKQKFRDSLKVKLCKKHNVHMIHVPYYIEYEDLPTFILTEAKKIGIKIPSLSLEIYQDLSGIYSPQKLKEMQMIAKDRGGSCLSDHYFNSQTNLTWECAKGHRWNATPAMVKSGSWCHACGGSLKLTLENAIKIASLKGGKCLSKEYINANTPIEWECAKGHRWKTSYANVRKSTWCPYCAEKAEGSLNEMIEIAIKRGGYCLSNKYVNRYTKMKFVCKYGHIWETSPSSIISGKHWCPHCHGKK